MVLECEYIEVLLVLNQIARCGDAFPLSNKNLDYIR